MLNWFTFGVMFLTIVLLIITCIYLNFKNNSEDFTIETLINTYISIINKLEDENKELKKENKELENKNKILNDFYNKEVVK